MRTRKELELWLYDESDFVIEKRFEVLDCLGRHDGFDGCIAIDGEKYYFAITDDTMPIKVDCVADIITNYCIEKMEDETYESDIERLFSREEIDLLIDIIVSDESEEVFA